VKNAGLGQSDEALKDSITTAQDPMIGGPEINDGVKITADSVQPADSEEVEQQLVAVTDGAMELRAEQLPHREKQFKAEV
jgi:hypothetical protein